MLLQSEQATPPNLPSRTNRHDIPTKDNVDLRSLPMSTLHKCRCCPGANSSRSLTADMICELITIEDAENDWRRPASSDSSAILPDLGRHSFLFGQATSERSAILPHFLEPPLRPRISMANFTSSGPRLHGYACFVSCVRRDEGTRQFDLQLVINTERRSKSSQADQSTSNYHFRERFNADL